MERLTERYVPNDEKNGISGIKVFESENKIPLVKVLSGEYLYTAIEKLATYEDLEEQGLLVRLPVPLGSKVYWISTRDKQNPIIFEKIFVLGMLYFWDSTVFPTREEAEKKLEEMKK